VTPGQLRKYDNFRSKFLRNQRDIVVYAPPDYDQQPERRYPVLYMHDGQNLFDAATAFNGQDWHVAQTADYAISAGLVEPLIVVGLYNTGKTRLREYTPTSVPRLGGGRADRYAKFLIEEVKPVVDRDYRTKPEASQTGLGGSSLGGLVSIYLGLKFSNVFSKIAALSPSVWWNQRVIVRFAQAAPVEPRPRIWLDIGTREGPRIVDDVEKFRDVLLNKGWQNDRDLHYERVEGAEHNEAAWAARVGPFLQFLFPAG
jgi:predicted alpha/beta superfamily hydrolase